MVYASRLVALPVKPGGAWRRAFCSWLLFAGLWSCPTILSAQFASFPIPTANSGPSSITVGPDGALWFTENNAATVKVARITTAGVITEFPTGIAPGLCPR
jgi:hypothetical protein